jgi:hypothetical protein
VLHTCKASTLPLQPHIQYWLNILFSHVSGLAEWNVFICLLIWPTAECLTLDWRINNEESWAKVLKRLKNDHFIFCLSKVVLKQKLLLYSTFFFSILGIKPRSLHMVDKHSTTVLTTLFYLFMLFLTTVVTDLKNLVLTTGFHLLFLIYRKSCKYILHLLTYK